MLAFFEFADNVIPQRLHNNKRNGKLKHSDKSFPKIINRQILIITIIINPRECSLELVQAYIVNIIYYCRIIL